MSCFVSKEIVSLCEKDASVETIQELKRSEIFHSLRVGLCFKLGSKQICLQSNWFLRVKTLVVSFINKHVLQRS